jgi:hypothetical protein
VAMRFGVTPVPIPNTTVKTKAADGTMLETAWESRWPPENLSIVKILIIEITYLENCIYEHFNLYPKRNTKK